MKQKFQNPLTLPFVLLLVLTISCTNNKKSTSEDAAIADETQTSDWLAYGRTHNERRFSPDDEISVDNVANLKVDWYLDLPNDVVLVSTPLVVDGVLYFTGTMNVLRAVDAVTGKLIWEFDPQVGEVLMQKRQIGWAHSRGISYYEGKIFTATCDGRLIAVDAKTGEKIWSVETFSPERALYITGAPKAFKGKVLIGNGGTENGPTRGWVTAYDANTGEEAWKFYIVPGNPADGFENKAMEMAAKTWTGEWWKHGGGGNAWHGFTYDEDLDVLYIGTGNGSPWNREIRSPGGGDNLFLCSIVALNPNSGEYLWHYQTTPGESWDYNSNMDIVLADLTIDGKKIKALLHAPKNGFFYVINRETGKLISAKPYAETTWASHIDMETGRPVEIEGARYINKPFDITPNGWGAHSWQSMSYNPQTGLVYIPTQFRATKYSAEGIDIKNWRSIEFLGGIGVNLLQADKQPRDYPAALQAWDPVKQELVWSVTQENLWNAGTLTSAGNLVFQGRADGKFIAYNATTGEIVWTFDAGLGISAPPITYKINGRQYISLLVGWGGGFAGLGGMEAQKLGWSYRTHTRRLIAFSLDGNAEMPELPAPSYPKPIVPADFVIDEKLAAQGAQLYGLCRNCHGGGMFSGGMAPDLRASEIALDLESFKAVLNDGAFTYLGMPKFAELTDDNIKALMHYIRKTAKETMPVYESLIANQEIQGNDVSAGH